MPIEIREIVVKTHINEQQSNKEPTLTDEMIDEIKEDITNECFDRVMAALKKQQER